MREETLKREGLGVVEVVVGVCITAPSIFERGEKRCNR
jgi:hypothetical protein